MHVPELRVGGILFRADFRAFYEVEHEHKAPLSQVLSDLVGRGFRGLYQLAWHLSASWRRRQDSDPTWEDFLDRLPDAGDLGQMLLQLVDEAVTPVCPVDVDHSPSREPRRVRWSQLMFEGRHLLVQAEEEWWLSTFRTQQALMWEWARHNDPEGKGGRPMADWEIEAVNNRNLELLMGMRTKL